MTMTINNKSGTVISNVQALIGQETVTFNTLENNSNKTRAFRVTEDTGVKIKFTPNHRPLRQTKLNVHLGRGYRGSIEVTIYSSSITTRANLSSGLF